MHDLTKGNPLSVILHFALPLLIGSFFQLTYNFADSIIVGQTLGQTAFASVGSTGSLVFLILGFAQGLTSGLCIVTAQKFGAGQEAQTKKSFVHGLFYSLLVSLVLTLLALLYLRPILLLMQTPSKLLSHSHQFLSAIFGGMIFTVFFNYLSNAIRALGNSKTPLIALVLACLINIVLDFVFILSFHMGVFGAGLATIIAQAFSVVYLWIYIQRYVPYFQISKKDWTLDRENLMEHARLGFPMAFQASIIAIGTITLQIALNKLGDHAVAAQAIASKMDLLAMLPMVNLGLAISTFTAQNYGAKQYQRILEGLKKTLVLTLGWALFFALMLILFHRFFSELFLPHANAIVLELAFVYYLCNGAAYWILAILFILRSFIQGLGYGLIPTLAGFMELVMRVVVAIVGLLYFGFVGIALASPAAWLGSVAILLPSTLFLTRKLRHLEQALT